MGYLDGSMIALCLHTQFNFTNMEALLLMRLINIDARGWRYSGEDDKCGQSTCLGLTLTVQSLLPNFLILPPKENLRFVWSRQITLHSVSALFLSKHF